ncbi:MAG TPA: lyase family protein [Burkholderiaceae bacterium]|nr:lyase family protein [Burkholderiaceae bacterium]
MTAIGSGTSTAGSRLSSLVDDGALLAAMLRYEAALARALADCGLAPRAAADAIGRVCESLAQDSQATRESFDATVPSAHQPAHPPPPDSEAPGTAFVRRLTELVAAADTNAARFVHFGASNVDLIDTATMLVARAGARELDTMLAELGDALAALADRHRDTLVPVPPSASSPSTAQAASSISLGWRAAGWLDQLARTRRLLERTLEEQAALQFGGVDGALAEMGEAAPQLTRALAEGLSLPAASISWHGARDRIARIGAELAMVCGAMVRVERELPQSALPGADAAPALAAAQRAPVLAGTLLAELAPEREPMAAPAPQADPARVLRELFEAAGSSVEAIRAMISELPVKGASVLETGADRSAASAQGLVGATAMLDAVLDDWDAQRSETTG